MNKREVIVVKIARGPSGFDFSIKGGAEHGIGLIVSDIKEEGVAGQPKRKVQSFRIAFLMHRWRN